MNRLNLTLDTATYSWIKRYAAKHKLRQASVARRLLAEAVARQEALAFRRKLVSDYSAGRADASAIVEEMERGQLELTDDDED